MDGTQWILTHFMNSLQMNPLDGTQDQDGTQALHINSLHELLSQLDQLLTD